MIFACLFVAACFLAYSNGANDNSKGIATLYGSRTTDFRRAIRWATVMTFLGSVAAVFLASVLLRNFSGKGLVPDELVQTPSFATAVALGAALTVCLATRIGMPISTTHSLVGALSGSGAVAMGDAFSFSTLGSTFLFPLLASPLLAAVCSFLFYHLFRTVRLRLGVTRETCVCVGESVYPVSQVNADGTVMFRAGARGAMKVATEEECQEFYQGGLLAAGPLRRVGAQKILDTLHYASSGFVSFARGLNDTPKIAGLLLVLTALDIEVGLVAIGAGMAMGGLIHSRRVGETVSNRITPMNHGQGFTANLVTGLLVTTASIHGLPVSTTHVLVGSIFAIGKVTGEADMGTVSRIMLSWVLTFPVGFTLSAGIYWIFQVA